MLLFVESFFLILVFLWKHISTHTIYWTERRRRRTQEEIFTEDKKNKTVHYELNSISDQTALHAGLSLPPKLIESITNRFI